MTPKLTSHLLTFAAFFSAFCFAALSAFAICFNLFFDRGAPSASTGALVGIGLSSVVDMLMVVPNGKEEKKGESVGLKRKRNIAIDSTHVGFEWPYL